MKSIIVASKNPVKITAVRQGYQRIFPQQRFDIAGVDVSSGVRDQPQTDAETYQGAYNRALNASTKISGADFYIGLEGGIEEQNDEMNTFAWIVVRSSDGRIGKGKTGTLFLPPAIKNLIHQGKELGEADDIVFGTKNSKEGGGALGLLTHNALNRTESYTIAVILAFTPFKNEALYFKT